MPGFVFTSDFTVAFAFILTSQLLLSFFTLLLLFTSADDTHVASIFC
jgi:hypothetical protein